MSKEKVDQYLSKFLSRKLLVWLTAGLMVGLGKIDSESWVSISLAYIGSEGVIDLVNRYKGNK